MNDRNPTTRRFPRSLQEAYPREHANTFVQYPSIGLGEKLLGVVLAIVIGVLLAWVLVKWWSS